MNLRRSGLRWSTTILLAATGLVLGVYLLRGVLLYPYLRTAAVAVFESDLDLHLSLGDISGPLFGSLALTEVQVRSLEPADTPLEATIPKVRLSYRLIDLLRGIDAFIGGLSIDLDRPMVRIDLSRPSSANLPDDAQEPFGGWPEILPRVSIHDGQLDLKGNGYGSRFDGILLSSLTGSGKGVLALQIEVKDWRWHLPPLRDGQVEARARVAVDASGVLVVHQLALNNALVVGEGRVDLSRLPQSLSFNAQIPPENGNLTVNGRHDDETLQLQIVGDDVDLAFIEHILDVPDLDLAGNVALQVEILLPYAHPELLRGEAAIQAGVGQWQALPWEHITMRASAGEGTLAVHQAELQGDDNTLRLQDVSLPAGAVFDGQIDALLAGLTAAFDCSLHNIPALLAAFGQGAVALAGPVPPHELTLKGRVQQGILLVEEGQLVSGGSAVHLNRLQADLRELKSQATEANLDAELTLDVPDLEDMAALLLLPPLAGQLRGELVITGSLQTPQGTLALQGKNLVFAGHGLGDLDVFGRSDGRWLTAESIQLSNRDDRVHLSGRMALASGRLEGARIVAQIQNIGPYANAVLPENWPAEGRFNLQAAIEGTFREPRIEADLALTASAMGPVQIEMARGRLHASRDGMDIERIDVHSSLGEFGAAGRIGYAHDDASLTVDLADLAFQRDGTQMRMVAPTRISRLDDGRWRFAPIALKGSAGHATVTGDLGGGHTDFLIDLVGVRSEKWLADLGGPVLAFEGLDARVRLTGTASAPQIEIAGRLQRLELRNLLQPLQGRFDIAGSDAGIKIQHWDWNDDATQQFTAVGQLPLIYDGGWQARPGPLRLEAELKIGDWGVLQGLLPNFPVASATAQARLDLKGTLASPSGTFRCDITDLQLVTAHEGLPQVPFEAHAAAAIRPGRVDLHELRIESDLMSLQGQGRWLADDQSAPWLAITGQLPSGSLTASAEVSIPDLGWLAAFTPGIQRISGRLNGSVHISGPTRNPTVVADILLADGSLRPEGDAPPLKALNADVQADADRMTIRSCSGEIGGAPFQLTGDLRRTGNNGWSTDLHLTGTNLLFYRSEGVRVRANTDLSLKGPLERMTLNGEIGLTSGQLSRNVDFFSALKEDRPSAGVPAELLFSLPDPPLKDLKFDVRITSPTPFIVRNNVIRGSVRPDLHLGGTGELPLLTGEIYVDPSRVRLPAGSMQFSTGVVRFLASRPNRPELNLLGEGRAFDYDITALIEGPADKPQITLSSSPPLPGNELMLMLITGQPPATENRTTTEGVSMNLAVYIGQDLISQLFGSDEAESWESIVDRFEVTLGRRMTRAGDETLETQFRVGEDVFMDGDTLYITGEKDMYDFYNAGLKFVFRFN